MRTTLTLDPDVSVELEALRRERGLSLKEHGLELNSIDGDFARFPGLRWRNPLAPKQDS